MHARMFVIQASPEGLEEAVRLLRETAGELRALPGFRRANVLVDRQGGELVTMTMWESERAMSDAVPRARELLGPAVQALGAQVPQPKLYEVAIEI
jgi:hypothetical protein